jgi:hypothetical protein
MMLPGDGYPQRVRFASRFFVKDPAGLGPVCACYLLNAASGSFLAVRLTKHKVRSAGQFVKVMNWTSASRSAFAAVAHSNSS